MSSREIFLPIVCAGFSLRNPLDHNGTSSLFFTVIKFCIEALIVKFWFFLLYSCLNLVQLTECGFCKV